MGFVSDQMMDIMNRNRGDVSGAVNEFLNMAAPLLQQQSSLPFDHQQVKDLAARAITEVLQTTKSVRGGEKTIADASLNVLLCKSGMRYLLACRCV